MTPTNYVCPRCSGIGGAHFAQCFLAQAWERFMGPGYPFGIRRQPAETVAAAPDEWTPPTEAEQRVAELERKLAERENLYRTVRARLAERDMQHEIYVAHVEALAENEQREAATTEQPAVPAEMLSQHAVHVEQGQPRLLLQPSEIDKLPEPRRAPTPADLVPRPTDEEVDQQIAEAEAAATAAPALVTPPAEPRAQLTRIEPGTKTVPLAVRHEWVTEFVRQCTEKGDYVTPPGEITDAYNAWALANGGPKTGDRGPSSVGASLKKLGYTRTERNGLNGYAGLRVKRTATTTPSQPAETPAEAPKPRSRGEEARAQTEAIRAAAAKAAEDAARALAEAAEREAAEQAAAEARAREAERSANNGWLKDPVTGGMVKVEELTVEEVHAENAAVMESTARERGPAVLRPPANGAMHPDSRDLINALLDLAPESFEFLPPGGRGKAQVRVPDGTLFQVASTPSSVKGPKSDIELRRWLNRNGWLPIASAPINKLQRPAPKDLDKRVEQAAITVQRADGRVMTVEQLAEAEAARDKPPLDPAEMDASLHDLWIDVRAGMSRTFDYSPEVDSLYGIDKEAIKAAVVAPEAVEVRPESKDKGYPVMKFRRGDVNVIMGFKTPSKPRVIRAEWSQLLSHDTHRVDRHGGGGKKGGTGVPTTPSALATALRNRGAKLDTTADGKTAEVTYGEQSLGKVTLLGSNRTTIENDWQRMQRKMQAIDQRAEKVSATV